MIQRKNIELYAINYLYEIKMDSRNNMVMRNEYSSAKSECKIWMSSELDSSKKL